MARRCQRGGIYFREQIQNKQGHSFCLLKKVLFRKENTKKSEANQMELQPFAPTEDSERHSCLYVAIFNMNHLNN